MWYPSRCPECDTIESHNLRNTTWVTNEMGSFPVIHGFLPLSSGGGEKGGYPMPHMGGLRRSATCGIVTSSHFYPSKGVDEDELPAPPQLINGRLTICDGKVNPADDDDDDIAKAKLSFHDGTSRSVKGSKEAPDDLFQEGFKKSRDYSDDSLTPDSTLPAVIRRRNRNRRKKLATSLVEPSPGGVGWESEAPKPMPRNRSQSISDDQWAQVMASQGGDGTGGPSGPSCPPGHTPADMSAFVGATTRRGYNTMGGRGSSFGRGMVSSASVCDLNSLAQQQPPHGFNGTHPASSFQQLNMMGYPGGMPMWGAPCDLCTPAHMLASQANASGMKRTASNLSMNLSSVGSDVTGYPWGPPPPHVHHHMPPMFPGYYPGYHPHMGPPAMGSLNMSIPDSMNTFGKVPSSPAPSLRSSSHRSHKSSKSRSFSGADVSGRRSRNRRKQRSEESEESRSSSVSDDDDDDGRNNKVGSSLAWQCDHCTFINSGGVRTCGMCSKTMGSGGGGSGRSSRRGSERHRSDRRRDRRTDHEDDDRDVSDYDNDGGVVKSNLSFNIKDNRRESRTKVSSSNKSKSKKKSRRRGSSASASESASDGEEERLERHMRDLRVSSSSRRRGSDYESVSNKDRDRDRDRDKGSRKREGKLRWKE